MSIDFVGLAPGEEAVAANVVGAVDDGSLGWARSALNLILGNRKRVFMPSLTMAALYWSSASRRMI